MANNPLIQLDSSINKLKWAKILSKNIDEFRDVYLDYNDVMLKQAIRLEGIDYLYNTMKTSYTACFIYIENNESKISKKYRAKLISIIKQLEYANYNIFLRSLYWRIYAEYQKYLIGYKCQLCSKKEKLNVHHNIYKRVGEELMNDFHDTIVLCNSCHKRYHLGGNK